MNTVDVHDRSADGIGALNCDKMKMDYIKPEISGNEMRLRFLTGELVFTTTSFILEFIEKMLQSTRADRIVLDLSSVVQIDSSAAGMFIALKNKMKKSNKTLVIKGLSDGVRRILHYLDVEDFLELDAA
ncbi:MAG TPA: STAS domain-containing protein [Spirochaetota bacterium]|nr:STAS domain-containing protein [Spirochaetota bacterium]HPC42732.1 STAS domain-containing protein [Spirochaetota bacterium]HPL18144.1 STAS domain-containing protein [Spirochaetota bacterium]HQF08356.1 STAS domain-containing protein [Spirochaetota bacterium]HQH98993.1 STAS domain-containing protein [Spirochaetota bacterium]